MVEADDGNLATLACSASVAADAVADCCPASSWMVPRLGSNRFPEAGCSAAVLVDGIAVAAEAVPATPSNSFLTL